MVKTTSHKVSSSSRQIRYTLNASGSANAAGGVSVTHVGYVMIASASSVTVAAVSPSRGGLQERVAKPSASEAIANAGSVAALKSTASKPGSQLRAAPTKLVPASR